MTRAMPRRSAVVCALVVVGAMLCSACQSEATSPQQAPVNSADFVALSDCVELEKLASAEVDRITATDDPEVVAEATGRFHEIVARIDTVCN